MEGRDPDRDWDVDDWFDEPDTSPPLPRRGSRRTASEPPREDEWVVPREPRRAPRRSRPSTLVVGGRTLTYPQAAIAGVAAIAVLLALLAAFGVFSSSGNKAAATLPITTPTVTKQTTTAPAPTKSSQVTVPTSTLKPGDTGAKVKQLQRALKKAGYSPGAADGSYGPGTKAAVEKFQSAQGLAADGVAGPKTLAALRQTVSG